MGNVHTGLQIKEYLLESVFSLYNLGLENWIQTSMLGHKYLYLVGHVAGLLSIHFVVINIIVNVIPLPLTPLNKAFFH